MKTELNKKLKRQVVIAWSQLILTSLLIIVFLVIVWSLVDSVATNPADLFSSFSNAVYWIVGLALVLATIPKAILWLFGIVNAISINNTTDSRNVLLVVFAVLPFALIHLIIAYMTRSKELGLGETVETDTTTPSPKAPVSKNIKLRRLDQAFMDGIVTSKEYEEKKKLINKGNK